MSRRRQPKKIRGIENRLHADGTWTFRVRFVDPATSERLSEEFDDQDDAIDFKAELRRAKRGGRVADLTGGRMLLRDFVERQYWPIFASVELERATLATYASVWNTHALPRIGHLELRQFDVAAAAQTWTERVVRDGREMDSRRRKYEGPTPYWLRHAKASLHIHAGDLSLAELADEMGHSIQTLIRDYTHLIKELAGQAKIPAEQQIQMAREVALA